LYFFLNSGKKKKEKRIFLIKKKKKKKKTNFFLKFFYSIFEMSHTQEKTLMLDSSSEDEEFSPAEEEDNEDGDVEKENENIKTEKLKVHPQKANENISKNKKEENKSQSVVAPIDKQSLVKHDVTDDANDTPSFSKQKATSRSIKKPNEEKIQKTISFSTITTVNDNKNTSSNTSLKDNSTKNVENVSKSDTAKPESVTTSSITSPTKSSKGIKRKLNFENTTAESSITPTVSSATTNNIITNNNNTISTTTTTTPAKTEADDDTDGDTTQEPIRKRRQPGTQGWGPKPNRDARFNEFLRAFFVKRSDAIKNKQNPPGLSFFDGIPPLQLASIMKILRLAIHMPIYFNSAKEFGPDFPNPLGNAPSFDKCEQDGTYKEIISSYPEFPAALRLLHAIMAEYVLSESIGPNEAFETLR